VRSRVGIGVVGAGSIGIRGALAHLSLEDVQDRAFLAAVCDPVPGRAASAAERFGVARAYESYEDLLEDPTVDAVTLCTPIVLHYEQGLQAIEAWKHVHFNKTMTTTAADAVDLIERAEIAGVTLVASPGEMLRPLNRAIRRLVDGGVLGRVSWAMTGAAFGTYHEEEPVRQGGDTADAIDPSWYWRKPGGGPLYDMTVYGLHALTGILGPAKRVAAMSGMALEHREFQGVLEECTADDNSLLLLDFGASVFGFVHGTFAGNVTGLRGVNVYGSEGVVEGGLHNGFPIDYPGRERARPGQFGDVALLPHVTAAHAALEEAHVFEDVMQLVDCVRDGVTTVCDPLHAAHVIEIIEAGYRSAETGRAQELATTFGLELEELPVWTG
jgi:predicted dehydrogenase